MYKLKWKHVEIELEDDIETLEESLDKARKILSTSDTDSVTIIKKEVE